MSSAGATAQRAATEDLQTGTGDSDIAVPLQSRARAIKMNSDVNFVVQKRSVGVDYI